MHAANSRFKSGFTWLELVVILAVLILLAVCIYPAIQAIRKAAIRAETPVQRLVLFSSEIVSNPNSWDTNSKALVEFSKAASDLRVNEDTRIKRFKLAALDLISFGSGWVDQLNTIEKEKLSSTLKPYVSNVKFGVDGEVSTGFEGLESSTTSNLTESEQAEFKRLYSEAIEAFVEVYELSIGLQPE
jgi:type II secretory pathway pseudopilin PulG